MSLKRVVVTGLGALTPLGKSVAEFWQGLADGVNGCDFIKQFDATKFKTRFACEVKDFEPTNYLDRKEARKIDRFTQFALIASDEAVKDAGISRNNVDVDRVGVIVGSGIGGLITFQEEVINFANGDGTPRFNPFFIPKMIEFWSSIAFSKINNFFLKSFNSTNSSSPNHTYSLFVRVF